jgi:hypothetical protein
MLGQRAGNRVRVLIAATCICLSACTGSLEKLASTDSEEKEHQPTGQGGACTKLSELKIGMTASEVVSACGQKPTRTSDIISGGKKIEIWVYANSKLHLTEDKLVRIFDLE